MDLLNLPTNQQTFLLDMKIDRMTTSKKVNPNQIQTDADRTLLRVSKVILDCPEMKAVRRTISRLRERVDVLKIPTAGMFRSGMYLMPYSLMEQIESLFAKTEAELATRVDDLINVYEASIQADRERLNSLFKESDYPLSSDVRSAFKVTWSYQTISTPEGLKVHRMDIYKREAAKMKALMEAAAAESRDALIHQALELARHVADKLTPGEDGKPKMIRESSLTNWEEFCDLFSHKNIAGDSDLEKVLADVKAALGGRKAKDLRTDAEAAAEIKALFDGVVGKLDEMVVAKPIRKITLEEDQEVA